MAYDKTEYSEHILLIGAEVRKALDYCIDKETGDLIQGLSPSQYNRLSTIWSILGELFGELA